VSGAERRELTWKLEFASGGHADPDDRIKAGRAIRRIRSADRGGKALAKPSPRPKPITGARRPV